MAIDTEDKRRSALRMCLPVADASVDTLDRIHIVWHYRLSVGAPAPAPAPSVAEAILAQSTSTRIEEEAKLVKVFDAIPAWRIISTYVVNSAGAKDMSVNGSGGSPQVFSYSPPANYDFIANRFVLYLQTSSAMSVDVFANLGSALGQGVEFKIGGVLLTTWQDNIDMYTDFYDKSALDDISGAAADTTMSGRWSFWKDTNGQGIMVRNSSSFEVVINDDLSTLTEFRMKIKGKLVAAGMQ